MRLSSRSAQLSAILLAVLLALLYCDILDLALSQLTILLNIGLARRDCRFREDRLDEPQLILDEMLELGVGRD